MGLQRRQHVQLLPRERRRSRVAVEDQRAHPLAARAQHQRGPVGHARGAQHHVVKIAAQHPRLGHFQQLLQQQRPAAQMHRVPQVAQAAMEHLALAAQDARVEVVHLPRTDAGVFQMGLQHPVAARVDVAARIERHQRVQRLQHRRDELRPLQVQPGHLVQTGQGLAGGTGRGHAQRRGEGENEGANLGPRPPHVNAAHFLARPIPAGWGAARGAALGCALHELPCQPPGRAHRSHRLQAPAALPAPARRGHVHGDR